MKQTARISAQALHYNANGHIRLPLSKLTNESFYRVFTGPVHLEDLVNMQYGNCGLPVSFSASVFVEPSSRKYFDFIFIH